MVDGNMVHFIFSGVPGVGKGSLADLWEARSVYPKISTGDLCRSKINANTKIGLMASALFGSGEWVFDAGVIEPLNTRLAKNALVKGSLLEMDASKPDRNEFKKMTGVLN